MSSHRMKVNTPDSFLFLKHSTHTNKSILVQNTANKTLPYSKQQYCLHSNYRPPKPLPYLHGELGHRVGDLLEEDGQEPRVEAADNALGLQDLRERRQKSIRVGRVGNEADTSGLERAKENVRHELGGRRRGEVDRQSVFPGLHAQ